MSTLTFVYEDSTAVLGPLSRAAEPNTYDLCGEHAARLTAPVGWELLRVEGGAEEGDDLVALADAVRSRPAGEEPSTRPSTPASPSGRGRREGGPHLQLVRDSHE